MDRRTIARTAITALSALLIAMVVLNFATNRQLAMAQTRIENVYEKAFYETCELTEAVSSNYRKLLVAGDAAQMQVLLGDITRQTQGASSNLALLPLGEETISSTIKFINQAEDFAETLSQKLALGQEPTDADYEAMETLSTSAAQFSLGMSKLLERFERGEAVFDASDFAVTGDESMYPLTDDAGQYPVLLYDGPFSDGAETGGYEMLASAPEITQQQAEDKLRAFIPVNELSYVGESHPGVDCYEFRVRSGDYTLSAGVTKQGGDVLYLLPETEESEIRMQEDQLCDIAKAFLISRGYGSMEMSYYARYGGILTINYAAVQDGVVLYPDLVKIQLSMKDGSVIGLDARSYLQSHRTRILPAPALTQEQAMLRLGNRLAPISARLCVIPQNGAEYFCYEITAADTSGDFLVYVDAQTGVERELMQIISRANGTLVM